ncbi:MAG TPA: hypothetical protein VFW96_05600 [Thermomicrobiales bacterium]|nr:hypothetical protein [Thermomicrobiales bacterium]
MQATLGITPVLAVIAWMAFRKMVRMLALQRVTPWLALRVVAGILLGVAVAVFLRGNLPLLVAAVGGLGLGLAAAGCGLSLARVERQGGVLCFRSNIFVELAVYAVVILRLAYRLALTLRAPAPDTAAVPATATGLLDQYAHDPWTTGALFLVIGYYIFFNGGILLQAFQDYWSG